MMRLSLRKPSNQQLQELLANQSNTLVSHENVGATEQWLPTTFELQPDSKVVNGDLHLFRRSRIGSGKADFTAAVNAIQRGIAFDLEWVERHQSRKFERGDTFCLMSRAFGIWTSSFCRVIYQRETDDKHSVMYSLGIGTLPWHAAKGEERLSVHWDLQSNQVDFLIGSFSRPSGWLSKLFVLYLRRLQNKFAIDSAKRLRLELGSSLVKSASTKSS